MVGSAFDDSLRRATTACTRAPYVRLRSSTNIPVPWRASAWVGALVLPLVMFGMIEASITRRPRTPRTLSLHRPPLSHPGPSGTCRQGETSSAPHASAFADLCVRLDARAGLDLFRDHRRQRL